MVGYCPLLYRLWWLSRSASTFSGVFPCDRPRRLDTLSTCVSTAITGLVVEDGCHDIAVLRPTPGRLIRLSMSDGITDWKSLTSLRASVYQVTGLAVGVGDGADQSQYVLEGGGGKVLGCRVSLKQGWSDHIDPLVGTLGREDDRDYELVSVSEVQFGLHGWAVGGETIPGWPHISV